MLGWLGLLLVGFAVAAWARRRRPPAAWKPRPVAGDRINRPGRAAGIVGFILGAIVLSDPARVIRALSGGQATQALYDAFAYDPDFLRLRGPVVLGLLIAGLVVQATLLWQGRWRPWLHRVDLVHSLVLCLALTWAIGVGPVFTAAPTDQAARGAAALTVLITLVDLAVRTRRQSVRRAVEIRE